MNEHPLYKYFSVAHLPEGPLKDISRNFRALAHHVQTTLPPGEETTVAMRKLLEAKDAAVRSALDLVGEVADTDHTKCPTFAYVCGCRLDMTHGKLNHVDPDCRQSRHSKDTTP